jgi:hypothetical protein
MAPQLCKTRRNEGCRRVLVMETNPDCSIRRDKAHNLHELAAPRPGASGSINHNVSPVGPFQMRECAAGRLLHSADDGDLLVDVLWVAKTFRDGKRARQGNKL